MTLSKAQAQAYMKYPSKCPYCRSEELYLDDRDHELHETYFNYRCNKCHEAWVEVQKIVGIGDYLFNNTYVEIMETTNEDQGVPHLIAVLNVNGLSAILEECSDDLDGMQESIEFNDRWERTADENCIMFVSYNFDEMEASNETRYGHNPRKERDSKGAGRQRRKRKGTAKSS